MRNRLIVFRHFAYDTIQNISTVRLESVLNYSSNLLLDVDCEIDNFETKEKARKFILYRRVGNFHDLR